MWVIGLVLNMISIIGFCIKERSMAKKVIFDGFNGQFDQIKLWQLRQKKGGAF